jgi:TolB-like protein/Tfp pilus assembly protein PilF
LEKIVKRCLEKQSSARYQTMTELKAALEKAVNQKVTASSEEPHPTIAVLPFVNMSGDKEQEYFSEGLAEEIINALTQISGLQVIARTSAFAFKGKDQDITKIAEALRVSNILEGSVRKSGNRIRVTAQLIEASKGIHLWSERYDRELTDVFTIQDEISQAITQKLKARLSGDRHSVKRPTENIEAYNLNLKGRYYRSKLTPDNLAKSKEYFEKAIELDPNYAAPWHGLAAIYGASATMGFSPPRTAIEQSRRPILKALELDDKLPEAHAHLAAISAIEFDWKRAERGFLRTLELGPNIWDAWYLYSFCYLIPMGRLDEALGAMQKAQELDPLSSSAYFTLGYIYTLLKQYDHAIELCRNALELDPNLPSAYGFTGFAHIMKGEPDKAIRIYDVIKPLLRSIPLLQGVLGTAYAMAGQTSEAHRILEELHTTARNTYVPSFPFAEIYLSLGEIDECFDWLYKAVDDREPTISHVTCNPIFDPLRSHPRYKALLRKMNLEP